MLPVRLRVRDQWNGLSSDPTKLSGPGAKVAMWGSWIQKDVGIGIKGEEGWVSPACARGRRF